MICGQFYSRRSFDLARAILMLASFCAIAAAQELKEFDADYLQSPAVGPG
jgi:hypothetical protein